MKFKTGRGNEKVKITMFPASKEGLNKRHLKLKSKCRSHANGKHRLEDRVYKMTKCALCALFVSITVCLRSPDVTGLLEEVSQERLQNEEETRKQFRLHLQKQTEQKEKQFLLSFISHGSPSSIQCQLHPSCHECPKLYPCER